ncbi:cyclin-dependent kinase inhibitor 1 [Fopius arisanus]|uniref:CDKN1B protein n=1 Tax=Fopius arisanus TaxID=64838 RepID=A0A0C9R0G8_9HYME|nr:PREDICTED: cyclin-dependent kinase inhibitor 1-like [Fopius arisanus]
MSARVMNPGTMSEMRNLGGGKRATPNRDALARVRRDLFGPVDHAAARALAERELKEQSVMDAKRWGFDFRLEMPTDNSRYDWQVIEPQEGVQESYALRGMPYLRRSTESSPRKNDSPGWKRRASVSPMATDGPFQSTSEKTPPQVSRVPGIGEDPEELPKENNRKERVNVEPTTPVLPVAARKQSSITDFMKSRKRTLIGTKKIIVEPPEKIARNAGQIRS